MLAILYWFMTDIPICNNGRVQFLNGSVDFIISRVKGLKVMNTIFK